MGIFLMPSQQYQGTESNTCVLQVVCDVSNCKQHAMTTVDDCDCGVQGRQTADDGRSSGRRQ